MYDITDKQKAIQAIVDSDKEFLAPADIAPILGVNPHTIRLIARERPELLKFDFLVLGSRTKIPRIPFLKYIGINVDNVPTEKSTEEKRGSDNYTPITNEELVIAFSRELNAYKEEINQRIDNLEQQMQDINNILQAARNLVNALSGTTSNQQR